MSSKLLEPLFPPIGCSSIGISSSFGASYFFTGAFAGAFLAPPAAAFGGGATTFFSCFSGLSYLLGFTF
jgi:hypothetical protein